MISYTQNVCPTIMKLQFQGTFPLLKYNRAQILMMNAQINEHSTYYRGTLQKGNRLQFVLKYDDEKMFRPPNVPIACFLLFIHVHNDDDDELIFQNYTRCQISLEIDVILTQWMHLFFTQIISRRIYLLFIQDEDYYKIASHVCILMEYILYATPSFQYIQHVIKIYNTSVLSKLSSLSYRCIPTPVSCIIDLYCIR